MKKSISLLLMLVSIVVFGCMGCSSEKNGKGTLAIEDGILSWEAADDAAYYFVDIEDVRVTCKEEQLNLTEACKYQGNYKVTVSCVSEDGKQKEVGTLDITAQAVARPQIVIQKGEDEKTSFVWTAQERVSAYQYDLHDGYGTRVSEIGEDGKCKVDFDGRNESVITVTAKGNSDGNVVYFDSTSSYHYDGTELFNLADLAKCPFYITTDGQLLNELVVGTTLSKGNYDLEITFALMDPNGRSLSGNGAWGRRVTHLKGNSWFCDSEVDGWPGSGGTLPAANESITYTCNQNVNKYGETTLSLYSFKPNEMLVVTDVKLNGKSVMAEKLVEHEEEQSVVFDVSRLDEFLAVYKGTGRGWHPDFREEFEFSIPTNLEDGEYQLEISYQLMNSDGTGLDGNGTGMRRIYDESMREVVWWCEYPIAGQTQGMDKLPGPDETLKSTFTATVKNGHFKIMCLHFNQGELMAVSSVKKISGSSRHFDLSTLNNYKYVFTCDRSVGTFQKFRIGTTKCERGQVELEISYYAMNKNGYMLTGNGSWGRRMVDEGADELWFCTTAPAEAHQDAVNTVPEPDQLVTKKVLVTLNKKGTFFLDMYDFLDGEMVVIADVKYNGESILAK